MLFLVLVQCVDPALGRVDCNWLDAQSLVEMPINGVSDEYQPG